MPRDNLRQHRPGSVERCRSVGARRREAAVLPHRSKSRSEERILPSLQALPVYISCARDAEGKGVADGWASPPPPQSCQNHGSALGETSGLLCPITPPQKKNAMGGSRWLPGGGRLEDRRVSLALSSQTHFQRLLRCRMLPGCKKTTRGCTKRFPELPDAPRKRTSPGFGGEQRAKAPVFHRRESE